MTDERQIAKQAEKMLESALRSQATSSFKEHILKTGEGRKRVRDAAVKAVVKKYSAKLDDVSKENKENFYLKEIKVKMHKVGFIQHYGVDNVREQHTRIRNGRKEKVEAHDFKMRATPWIDKAIERSDVLNYISYEIAKIRMNKVVVYIKNSIESGNL